MGNPDLELVAKLQEGLEAAIRGLEARAEKAEAALAEAVRMMEETPTNERALVSQIFDLKEEIALLRARVAELEEIPESIRHSELIQGLEAVIRGLESRAERAEALLVRNPKHDPPTNEPWAYEFYGNLVPAGAFAPSKGFDGVGGLTN